jgi:hypothetical protein
MPRCRLYAPIAGGSAGSLAMDIVQYAWARTFEQHRANDEQDEETEAIGRVVTLLGNLVPRIFPRANAAATGHVVHYFFASGICDGVSAALPRPAAVTAARSGLRHRALAAERSDLDSTLEVGAAVVALQHR